MFGVVLKLEGSDGHYEVTVLGCCSVCSEPLLDVEGTSSLGRSSFGKCRKSPAVE